MSKAPTPWTYDATRGVVRDANGSELYEEGVFEPCYVSDRLDWAEIVAAVNEFRKRDVTTSA